MSQLAEELILKYKNGQCTPEEKELVERFFKKYIQDHPNDLAPDRLAQIDRYVWTRLQAEMNPPARIASWKYRLTIAASILLFIFAGVFWHTHIQNRQQALADIPAGGNKASITLSNGKKINLSEQQGTVVMQNNQLLYEDGSAALDLATDEIDTLTLTTPLGGQYHVILPDQTKVWLNAGSQLHYPTHFGSKERKVQLNGEAYFEVSKQTAPFRVLTNQQEVEVLGTSFNIMAYEEMSHTKTTLVQGAVKVSPITDGEPTTSVVLKPGEQLMVRRGRYHLNRVSVEDEIAWKSGDFVFNQEPLSSVMLQLSRWYAVSVHYEGNKPDIQLTSTISRSKSLKQVMEVLELNTGIHFEINQKERSIMVKP